MNIDYLKKKYDKFYKNFLLMVGSKENSMTKSLYNLFLIALGMILFVLIINLIFAYKHEGMGSWGDFFGGTLNPILTFLTFMGLLITIVIQQTELSESKKEFAKSANALDEQSKSLKKQNFENTLFNMIDLHNKMITTIRIDIGELRKVYNLKKELKSNFIKILNSVSLIKIDKLENSEVIFNGHQVFAVIVGIITEDVKSPTDIYNRYKDIQQNHNYILGHYFRNLYQLLKLIDNVNCEENVLTKNEQFKYASIIRAQLSSNELILLFINCLNEMVDNGKFKNLLIKYSILEHMPIERDENTQGYKIKGRSGIFFSNEMVIEYKEEKDLSGLDFKKYFGGAFGENTEIVYNLK